MAGGEEKETKQVTQDPVLATACHEATHAVMDTRDGHGVSMAEIATWPSVFGRGSVTALGGEPLP